MFHPLPQGQNTTFSRLSGAPRPVCILRVTPVDTLQKAGQLRGVSDTVPSVAEGHTTLLEPLGLERQTDIVVPGDLDQRACAATEHEQIAAVRITLETLLHQQRQALHALANIHVAERDPRLRSRRDHRSPFSAAGTRAGGAAANMLSRLPRGTLKSAHHLHALGGPRRRVRSSRDF